MSEPIKIWIRFEVKRKDGSIVKLRIQDLPEDRLDDAYSVLLKYYVREEAINKVSGIYKNNEALLEYEKFKRRLKTKTTICCIDNDDPKPKILGLSAIQLVEGETKYCFEFETEELKLFYKVIFTMFQSYELKIYPRYEGRGILVDPEYRNMGIAQQFCKQRRLACKEDNVPLTCAWMTSIGTQKAAERDAWGTLYEVTFLELGTRCGVTFEDVPDTVKLMAAKPAP